MGPRPQGAADDAEQAARACMRGDTRAVLALVSSYAHTAAASRPLCEALARLAFDASVGCRTRYAALLEVVAGNVPDGPSAASGRYLDALLTCPETELDRHWAQEFSEPDAAADLVLSLVSLASCALELREVSGS